MQVPPSQGAIPKIKSPPQESVAKSQEDYDDLQPTKTKEFDSRGSNSTPQKDKVHSTHRHHKENQSIPMPSEQVVMHKDRPLPERNRRADGENAKRENREPKSASQKDRPHSERKHHGATHDELLMQRSSMDRESKLTPQKVRPHTERRHQSDKHDDGSPSPNDPDKDSKHARHKSKHSGRKHHGDKWDDKVLTSKSSETNVNKEIKDPTFNSPKEENKQDSDAQKSSQSNISKEKKKNKPSSAYTSNKGKHAEKYEGLPLEPNDNENNKTRTNPNKEKETSDQKHRKIICNAFYVPKRVHGKITRSKQDISLIFPDENGNRSVMRIVVRSFASPTKSQNCVDVKIEGENFNSSNVKNPQIENLIRELTKYVIQIQKKLESDGDEPYKVKKDQQKSVEVIELFRRADKIFGKKEVPSSPDNETNKKQEHKKLSSTSESNDNKISVQSNGNEEADKTSKRKKDKKELKQETSRSKKGVAQESDVVVEDGQKANEEYFGKEDGEKSKENAQGTNEKRDPNIESEKPEGVYVDSRDKKEAKKRVSKKHHGKKDVGERTNFLVGENQRKESNPAGGQSEGADLGVHKKKSKKKRTREDVDPESETIPEGEDERRKSNPGSGKPEVGTIPKEKRYAKNQDSDNIDNMNPKKPKTKCFTETTCQNTQKKDQIKKTSGSKEEGNLDLKLPAGAKQDLKKHAKKKISLASLKNSLSKILIKLTSSKTTTAEGLTAPVRQKHKAKERSEKGKDTCKKSRSKVSERLSSSKGVQIPVLFGEKEPTLQSKSSVKILLEHSTEEGDLCLNLVGIRNEDTQDFGGRIQFSQSAKTAKKKCEDVETMKELLTNCVKKVENVLNNMYQEQIEASKHKQSKKVKLATKEKVPIEEAYDMKKGGGIMKKPSSTSIDETTYDANKRSESNKSLGSTSSRADRRISFKEDPIDLPFVGMLQDSELSEDEYNEDPNGEGKESDVDEEDAQYSKEKDVNDILEAKLDAGEFEREAKASFQRELFSASLKDPDAMERYRKSHSKLSLQDGEDQENQESGVSGQTSEASNQEGGVPLSPSWEANDSNSKTNLALSLSTEDKKTTYMLGISTFPDSMKQPEKSSIEQPISEVPSTDTTSNNKSISKGPSTSVYSMMIEPGTSQSESNTEFIKINPTFKNVIYESKPTMVSTMVGTSPACAASCPTFETQSTTKMSSTECSTSIYSMPEHETIQSESNAEPTDTNPTHKSSIYETKSPMVMVSSVTRRPNFVESSGGEETRSDKKGCCQLL